MTLKLWLLFIGLCMAAYVWWVKRELKNALTVSDNEKPEKDETALKKQAEIARNFSNMTHDDVMALARGELKIEQAMKGERPKSMKQKKSEPDCLYPI